LPDNTPTAYKHGSELNGDQAVVDKGNSSPKLDRSFESWKEFIFHILGTGLNAHFLQAFKREQEEADKVGCQDGLVQENRNTNPCDVFGAVLDNLWENEAVPNVETGSCEESTHSRLTSRSSERVLVGILFLNLLLGDAIGQEVGKASCCHFGFVGVVQ